jgi:hypothetical protein
MPFNTPPIDRRHLLKGLAAAAAATALPGAGCHTVAPTRNPVQRENQRAGTRDWLLSNTRVNPATRWRCPWIEGYCSRTSVRAGETLDIHVSTNPAAEYTLDLYRLGYYAGLGARQVAALGPFQGRPQPDPAVGLKRRRDCTWEVAYSLRIPDDWLSGVYLGKLTERREHTQSYVVFIVRDDRRANLLFQCSDTTWQAYNRWPDHFALYDDGNNEWYWGPDVQVSFNRPYGRYCQIFDAPLSQGSGEFCFGNTPPPSGWNPKGTMSPINPTWTPTSTPPDCAVPMASFRSATTSTGRSRCSATSRPPSPVASASPFFPATPAADASVYHRTRAATSPGCSSGSASTDPRAALGTSCPWPPCPTNAPTPTN